MLIKSNQAKLVSTAADILGKPKAADKTKKSELELSNLEQKIWDKLASEPCSVDELTASLKISVVELSQTVTQMSLKGLISESAGKYFINTNG